MRLNANEIAVRILATGKIQIVDQKTLVMCGMHYSQRKGCASRGSPVNNVGSATYTETHVTVEDCEMPRARLGFKYYPTIGSTVWIVSKLQHADGSFIAFAAEILDERNI